MDIESGWVARQQLQWRQQWESFSQTKFQGSLEGFSQSFWLGSSEVWHCQFSSKSSIQYYFLQILGVISNAVFMITFVRPRYSHRCAQYKWPSGDDVDTCDWSCYWSFAQPQND